MGRLAGLPRPPRADERTAVATALNVNERAFDDGLLAVVDADGPHAGAAAYRVDGRIARLGAIVLPPGVHRTAMYQLVRAAVLAIIATGATRGDFTLADPALLRQLQSDFRITAEPIGFAPLTQDQQEAGHVQTAVEWRIEVDLQDALAQLDKALASG